MHMQDLRDLMTDELKDLYSAETQLVKAMPKMMECATSDQLRQSFQMHFEQTQRQVKRLEQIFQQMGESPEGETCEAMQGLVAEAQELIGQKGDIDPEVMDAALIAAAQKVEHYEIASYGTACTWAGMLGESEAKNLLGQSLEEEKQTDQKLTTLAEQSVNRQAMSQ